MAVVASAQSGFWDDTATWTGGAVPIDGTDSATIGNTHHVQVRTAVAVGTSGAAGTSAITLGTGSTSKLTVTSTGTLTLHGDLTCQNKTTSFSDTIVIDGGGTIQFDPPSGVAYKLLLQQFTRFVGNGSSGARATLRTKSGTSGNKGYVQNTTTNQAWTSAWTDFIELDSGATSVNGVTGVSIVPLNFSAGSTANAGCTLTDCRFIRCGLVLIVIGGTGANRADTFVDIQRCQWTGTTHTNTALQFSGENTATPTAARNLKHCDLDKRLVFGTGYARYFDCTGTVFRAAFGSVPATQTVGPGTLTGALIRTTDASGIAPNRGLVWNDLQGCYFFSEPTTAGANVDNSGLGANIASSVDADATVHGCVWEHAGNGGGGEYTFWDYRGTPDHVITYTNNVFRMPGWPTGSPKVTTQGGMVIQTINAIPTHQKFKYHHNTFCFTGATLVSGGIYTGEHSSGTEVAATIPEIKSNIFYFSASNVGAKYHSVNASRGTDILTPGGVANNCGYQFKATSGSAYTNEGNGYWSNFSTTPGGSDISADPGYVDSTRSLATFSKAYLNLTAGAGTWADATAYAVGDVVEAQTSGFYANSVIQYRCIAAHTSNSASVTLGKPGSARDWQVSWEFASLGAIGDAQVAGTLITDGDLGLTNATYIETLVAWVKAGHAPTNATLEDAGHDGVTIGAVEGDFGNDVTLSADNGSYTLSGQSATLRVGRSLAAAAGSYTLSGQAAGLTASLRLTADAGSYSLAGQSATLTVTADYSLDAEAGSYSFSGQDATLSVTGVFTLDAEMGNYALSGQDAGLTAHLVISADTGSYALSGQSANLTTEAIPTNTGPTDFWAEFLGGTSDFADAELIDP